MGESVDDDTEDDVQGNDIDEHEETDIEDRSTSKFLARIKIIQRFGHTSTVSESIVEHEEEASVELIADVVSWIDFDMVEEVVHDQESVEVDDEHGQHEGQSQLVDVFQDGLHDELGCFREVDDQEEVESVKDGTEG